MNWRNGAGRFVGRDGSDMVTKLMEHELDLTTTARDVLLAVIAREQAAIARRSRSEPSSEKFAVQSTLAHHACLM